MKKTYLPQFAKEMHGVGKYAYEHKAALLAVINEATKLTDDEKLIARKAIDDVLAAHEVFKKIHLDYSRLSWKGNWVP